MTDADKIASLEAQLAYVDGLMKDFAEERCIPALGGHNGDFISDTLRAFQVKHKRLEEHCTRVLNAVKRYIAGEKLGVDDTQVESLLADHQRRLADERYAVFPTTSNKMPPLTVSYGSSGLEIKALLDRSYNCVEYLTNENKPQQVLIAPWIQFEPTKLADERLRIVMEIVRRAMAYDDVVKKLTAQEDLIEGFRKGSDERAIEQARLIELWRAERVAAGKPADFSDIDWSKT